MTQLTLFFLDKEKPRSFCHDTFSKNYFWEYEENKNKSVNRYLSNIS